MGRLPQQNRALLLDCWADRRKITFPYCSDSDARVIAMIYTHGVCFADSPRGFTAGHGRAGYHEVEAGCDARALSFCIQHESTAALLASR